MLEEERKPPADLVSPVTAYSRVAPLAPAAVPPPRSLTWSLRPSCRAAQRPATP